MTELVLPEICADNDGHPEKLCIELSHYKQKYHWDCGLSCVLMVVAKKDREHFLTNFNNICKKEGFNKSTWTIDLCYILKRYNIKHVYHTTTIGIHPGHSMNSYYTKILSKDEKRINDRFDRASENGISVKQSSLPLQYIIDQLRNGPIIVLTNAGLLSCDKCKFNKLKSELKKCIPWPEPYQGHYVVVCGYDVNFRKIYYRNPSFDNHVCIIPMEGFEQARKSPGTDEDIIFITTLKSHDGKEKDLPVLKY